MNKIATVLALCSFAAVRAWPGHLLGGGDLGGYGGGSFGGGHGGGGGGFGGGGGHGGGGEIQLTSVPDGSSFGGLSYPQYDLQDLGTVYEGQIPSRTIKVSNTIAVKIPKPYPVKIPYNVPYPVAVAKPYPVPVPQLIKVPHAVPIEVIKKVPVPVEVPKPYPVYTNEHKPEGGSSGGGFESYGGGFGGHQQLSQSYGIPHTSYGEPVQGGSGGESEGISGGGSAGGYDSYASQSQSSNSESGQEGQADQSVGYPAVAPVNQDQESESQEKYGSNE